MFAGAGDDLAFALLPAPTGADLLAILDRVIRRVARRLANEAGAANNTDHGDLPPDLFAQVQAEAAMTWRSPAPATAHTVRGSERLRAWCAGFSLHAGVVIPDHDREALERWCRYGARPAFAHHRLSGPPTAGSRTSSSGRGPTAAPTWCSNPLRSCADWSASSHLPGATWCATRGLFGPASNARAKLRVLVPATDRNDTAGCPGAMQPVVPRAGRLPWADLLRRVFI